MDSETIEHIAIAALENIKAKDITVYDVRRLTPLFEVMIIATGDSARQVKALADHVEEKLKEAGVRLLGSEGRQAAEWVLVDAGSVVIHVMHPHARQYYNLEELWGGVEKSRHPA